MMKVKFGVKYCLTVAGRAGVGRQQAGHGSSLSLLPPVRSEVRRGEWAVSQSVSQSVRLSGESKSEVKARRLDGGRDCA